MSDLSLEQFGLSKPKTEPKAKKSEVSRETSDSKPTPKLSLEQFGLGSQPTPAPTPSVPKTPTAPSAKVPKRINPMLAGILKEHGLTPEEVKGKTAGEILQMGEEKQRKAKFDARMQAIQATPNALMNPHSEAAQKPFREAVDRGGATRDFPKLPNPFVEAIGAIAGISTKDTEQAIDDTSGLAGSGAKFLESMVDPTNVAIMMAMPELNPVIQKVVSGAFAAQMAQGTFQQARQLPPDLTKRLKKGGLNALTSDDWKQLGNVAGEGFLALMAAGHASGMFEKKMSARKTERESIQKAHNANAVETLKPSQGKDVANKTTKRYTANSTDANPGDTAFKQPHNRATMPAEGRLARKTGKVPPKPTEAPKIAEPTPEPSKPKREVKPEPALTKEGERTHGRVQNNIDHVTEIREQVNGGRQGMNLRDFEEELRKRTGYNDVQPIINQLSSLGIIETQRKIPPYGVTILTDKVDPKYYGMLNETSVYETHGSNPSTRKTLRDVYELRDNKEANFMPIREAWKKAKDARLIDKKMTLQEFAKMATNSQGEHFARAAQSAEGSSTHRGVFVPDEYGGQTVHHLYGPKPGSTEPTIVERQETHAENTAEVQRGTPNTVPTVHADGTRSAKVEVGPKSDDLQGRQGQEPAETPEKLPEGVKPEVSRETSGNGESTPETPKPEEPKPGSEEFVGVRKAHTQEVQKRLGLADTEMQVYDKLGPAYERGKQAVIDRKVMPEEMVAELLKTPRVLKPEEVGALGYHFYELNEQFKKDDAIVSKLIEKKAPKKEIERAINQRQATLDKYKDAIDAKNRAGREASAALQAFKTVIGADGNLDEVKTFARNTKGAPLTADEEAKFEQLVKERDEAIGKHDALKEEYEKLRQQQQAAQSEPSKGTPKRSVRTARTSDPQSADFGKRNKVFASDRLESARAAIASRPKGIGAGGNVKTRGAVDTDFFSGPEPLRRVNDDNRESYVDIAGYYIEGGLRDYSAYAEAMLTEDPGMTDFDLQEVWRGARERLNKARIQKPPSQIFIDKMTARMTSKGALGFATDLTRHMPDLGDRLLRGEELDAGEKHLIDELYRKHNPDRPTPKPPTGPTKTVSDIVAGAKKARIEAKKLQRTPEEMFELHVRRVVGKDGSAKFFATIPKETIAKMIKGDTLTDGEKDLIGQTTEGLRKTPEPSQLSPAAVALRDAVNETRTVMRENKKLEALTKEIDSKTPDPKTPKEKRQEAARITKIREAVKLKREERNWMRKLEKAKSGETPRRTQSNAPSSPEIETLKKELAEVRRKQNDSNAIARLQKQIDGEPIPKGKAQSKRSAEVELKTRERDLTNQVKVAEAKLAGEKTTKPEVSRETSPQIQALDAKLKSVRNQIKANSTIETADSRIKDLKLQSKVKAFRTESLKDASPELLKLLSDADKPRQTRPESPPELKAKRAEIKDLQHQVKANDEILKLSEEIKSGKLSKKPATTAQQQSAELLSILKSRDLLKSKRNDMARLESLKAQEADLQKQATDKDYLKQRMAEREKQKIADAKKKADKYGTADPEHQRFLDEIDAAHKKVQQATKRVQYEAETLKPMTRAERVLTGMKAFKLSRLAVFSKLGGNTLWTMPLEALYDAFGTIAGHLPAGDGLKLRDIAGREGKFNPLDDVKALGKALKIEKFPDIRIGVDKKIRGRMVSKGVTIKNAKLPRFLQDARDTIIHHMDEIDTEAKRAGHKNTGLLDTPGRMHGATKSLLKRQQYEKALDRRLKISADRYKSTGDEYYNVANAETRARIGMAAANDAISQILMGDNVAASGVSNMISHMQNHENAGMRTAGHIFRSLIPIVRVSANYVGKGIDLTGVGGLTRGTVEYAAARRALLKNKTPISADTADSIIRAYKLGGAGMVAMYFGLHQPKEFKSSGMYNIKGKYNRNREGHRMEADSIQIEGVTIPPILAHHPFIMAVQFWAGVTERTDEIFESESRNATFLDRLGAMANSATGIVAQAPGTEYVYDALKVSVGQDRTPGKTAGEIVSGDIIPGFVQDVANYTDKENGKTVPRKTTGVVDTVQSHVPILRNKLPKKEPARSRGDD